MIAILELAWRPLGLNTINPPDSETDRMRLFVNWLDDNSFEASLSSLSEGYCNLIANLSGAKSDRPLVFAGRLDTVPLENVRWQYDPFGS